MFVGRNRLRLFNRLRRPAYYVIASATIKLAYPVSQWLHPNGAFQLVRSSDCIRQPGSFFRFLPVSIYYHTIAYLSTTFYNFIITFCYLAETSMQTSKMSANANVIQKTKLFVAPDASIAIIINSTVLNALLNLSSLFIIILLSAAGESASSV